MIYPIRFYKNKLPEVDEVVMVKVTGITELGAYVELLEYNKINGLILFSELTRRRIRSVNKLVRVGLNEAVVVLRVDKDKCYIDLSKTRATEEDKVYCGEKFHNGSTVYSIIRKTAESLELTQEQFEELYEKVVWKFNQKSNKPNYAYDEFKKCITDPFILDECQIPIEWKNVLLSNIKHRLAPKAIKFRADVEVSCYSFEGIDAIKSALKEGLKLSTDEKPVKINLYVPPVYIITAIVFDREEGINLLKEVMNKIKESILKSNGKFSVKMEPRSVTDVEETRLADELEKLELREIGGDSDSSEEVESNEEEKIFLDSSNINEEDLSWS